MSGMSKNALLFASTGQNCGNINISHKIVTTNVLIYWENWDMTLRYIPENHNPDTIFTAVDSNLNTSLTSADLVTQFHFNIVMC
jgi:hypothetical protein